MKKFILILMALCGVNSVFAQTANEFCGIPMTRDFRAGAKVLEEKGFKMISSASDSILLSGMLETFGECQVVLRELCQKVAFQSSESVDSILRERYGEPNVSEEGYETFYVSEYRVASKCKDGAFTRIAVVDLTEMFTIKFKGVTLGAPLKEVLPQLEKDFEYITLHKGFTVLKGKFAGYRDCTIYLNAEDEDEIVSAVSVYLPTTNNWNTLYSQYCNLKSSLTEKYGAPQECKEDLKGYRHNKILDLIYGDIICESVFGVSVFGDIQLRIFGYEDFKEGSVYLIYRDLLSVKKQNNIDAEDL